MTAERAALSAIEGVARESYGRLIAYLAARNGDVAGAEDALGDAFVAALKRWPVQGVPRNPEAWLMRAARNRTIDAARRRQARRAAADLVRLAAETTRNPAGPTERFPDERLKLLFVCAHPAIDPGARTPLMLQTVLGITTGRIASAFLVSPAALAQRLVRAKRKIRDAAIPFRLPDPPQWNERLASVLEAVYAAYTAGWDSLTEAETSRSDLSGEAVAIGRTLVRLLPAEPEARGLLALMLHCEARRPARLNLAGEFVPLDRQDPARWSRPLIDEAETLLRSAAAGRSLGRYQLEAAIQSIHAARAVTGRTDWAEITLLYEGLMRLMPGIGARVGRAVALAEAGHLDAGLSALDELPADRVTGYQPYWAARGHLWRLAGRREDAQQAFVRASSLTDEPALRAYLLRRAADLCNGPPDDVQPAAPATRARRRRRARRSAIRSQVRMIQRGRGLRN